MRRINYFYPPNNYEVYKNFLKRILDFVLALIGFMILSPIFLILYCILLYVNAGKPLFYQPRPGKNERIFKIVKFKTMTDKKGVDGELLPDAERMTRFGNFMRKTSLDEIPQLLNVIIGDMSLVGPRPLRVRYLPYYTQEEQLRHTVRPGITGLAQVSGRNSLNWDEKLSLDVKYVKTLSFWNDIIILAKTVRKILRPQRDEIELDLEINALDDFRKKA